MLEHKIKTKAIIFSFLQKACCGFSLETFDNKQQMFSCQQKLTTDYKQRPQKLTLSG